MYLTNLLIRSAAKEILQWSAFRIQFKLLDNRQIMLMPAAVVQVAFNTQALKYKEQITQMAGENQTELYSSPLLVLPGREHSGQHFSAKGD